MRQRSILFRVTAMALVVVRPGLAAETAPRCQVPESNQLVGLWESENRSKGGIGHAFEFRADGSFVESPTVLVDSYYRVSGDHLIVGDKPNPEPGKNTTPLPLAAMLGERVGSPVPGQPSHVGVWRSPFPAGGMAYQKLTPEGRLLFRLAMKPAKGCYRFDGTRLTLAIGGKETSGSAELRNDDLILRFPNRNADEYHRDPAGPWYELEN